MGGRGGRGGKGRVLKRGMRQFKGAHSTTPAAETPSGTGLDKHDSLLPSPRPCQCSRAATQSPTHSGRLVWAGVRNSMMPMLAAEASLACAQPCVHPLGLAPQAEPTHRGKLVGRGPEQHDASVGCGSRLRPELQPLVVNGVGQVIAGGQDVGLRVLQSGDQDTRAGLGEDAALDQGSRPSPSAVFIKRLQNVRMSVCGYCKVVSQVQSKLPK